MIRVRRDRLDVTRAERPTVDMQLTLDDGRVRHDLTVDVEDEVRATEAVLPVLVGEALVLVLAERGFQQAPNGADLCRRQVGRCEAAEPSATPSAVAGGRRVGRCGQPHRVSVSAIRARTMLVTMSAGIGRAAENLMAPLLVSNPARSAAWSRMTAGLMT